MKLKIILGLLLGVLNGVPDLFALSVDEAYKAIPHQQTTFNRSLSNAPAREKIFLSKIFSVTDQAMAARVDQLTALFYFKGQGDTKISSYNTKIGRLIGQINSLSPPASLAKYHKLILGSIQEQKQFFNEWAQASTAQKEMFRKTYAKHPMVQSSHHKLLAAYNELMRLFPRENKRNQQAFFDHLCALDFL